MRAPTVVFVLCCVAAIGAQTCADGEASEVCSAQSTPSGTTPPPKQHGEAHPAQATTIASSTTVPVAGSVVDDDAQEASEDGTSTAASASDDLLMANLVSSTRIALEASLLALSAWGKVLWHLSQAASRGAVVAYPTVRRLSIKAAQAFGEATCFWRRALVPVGWLQQTVPACQSREWIAPNAQTQSPQS